MGRLIFDSNKVIVKDVMSDFSYEEGTRDEAFANTLFERYLEAELEDRGPKIVSEWVELESVFSEDVLYADVLIDGVPAEVVYIEVLRQEQPDTQVAVVGRGATYFAELIADEWELAIQRRVRQLLELDAEIDMLAKRDKYVEATRSEFINGGLDDILKDMDPVAFHSMVRGVVLEQLGEWAGAVKRVSEAED